MNMASKKSPKTLDFALLAVAVLTIALVFFLYSKSMKNNWDGDYEVDVEGHCALTDGTTYSISENKFIQVLNNKIAEIDGRGPVVSSTIINANGWATVVVGIRGGGQETSKLTFIRSTNGGYHYIIDRWEDTAGCHGIGIGDRVSQYPSIGNQGII